MAASPLPSVPIRSDILLDANIFIYALLEQSGQCRELLTRCAREEIFAVTTFDAVIEATHRLMVAEGFGRGLIPKGTRNPAKWLKKRPEAVQEMSTYWAQVQSILDLNVLLLRTGEDSLRRAQEVRSAYGLLTRDSLLVAAMREYGLTSIASNDSDFDRVHELTRYQPADLVAPAPST